VYHLDSSCSVSAVTLTTVQTALAAEAHPAERQFLLEEETLNVENSRIYRAEKSNTDSFQK
jgi:hypothetical protein